VTALVLAAACAGLFALYLCQSKTAPFNSDGAANVLQARAIIGGNPLLRGWWTSDVSFYTTEIPEYALVTAIRGVSPAVVHWCGALSYLLTVLLAALVAKGGAGWAGPAGQTGPAGPAGQTAAGVLPGGQRAGWRWAGWCRADWCRAAVAVAVMLAPGLLGGTEVFLENPDHAGTAVPVLALLLMLDQAGHRRYLPWAVALLLAVAQIGDELTLAAATVPLAVVCTAHLVGRRLLGTNRATGAPVKGPAAAGPLVARPLVARPLVARPSVAGSLAARPPVAGPRADGPPVHGRRDAALVGAAAAAVVLARLAELTLRGLGGFDLRPLAGVALVPLRGVPGNVGRLWQSVVLLFGANQPGPPHQAQTIAAHPLLVSMAAVHVIGLVVAAAGLAAGIAAVAARRADRVTAVLVVAVLTLVAASLFSTLLRSLSNAHEIAMLLPLSAALAGRMLPALPAPAPARAPAPAPTPATAPTPAPAPTRAAATPAPAPTRAAAATPAPAPTRAAAPTPASTSASAPAAARRQPGLVAARSRTAAVAVLACWLAAGLAELGYAASWPAAPPAQQAAAAWLAAQHQDRGLAGYWQAAATTVASGGRVLVAPIVMTGPAEGRTAPSGHAGRAAGQPKAEADRWESSAAWYQQDQAAATFVIAVTSAAVAGGGLLAPEVRARFGVPATQHVIGQEVIMLYRYNLLARLAGTSFPGPG
jgi:hypothetical protein